MRQLPQETSNASEIGCLGAIPKMDATLLCPRAIPRPTVLAITSVMQRPLSLSKYTSGFIAIPLEPFCRLVPP